MTIDEASSFPTGMPALTADRRLLRNDVFEVLLTRILNGGFVPGERLKDAELTAWLRVSRTPVREALSRLVTLGLVRTAPNRFTCVAPLVESEIAGAVLVLQKLYPDAIAEALRLRTDGDELELRLVAGRLERDEDISPIEVFQRVLLIALASIDNQVLAEAIETVHLRVLRYLYLTPSAAPILGRERVLEFACAVASGDAVAIGMIESVLGDVASALERAASAGAAGAEGAAGAAGAAEPAGIVAPMAAVV
ncbi:hypothetical protein GCM10027406_26860 [Leifsonia lichenia]